MKLSHIIKYWQGNRKSRHILLLFSISKSHHRLPPKKIQAGLQLAKMEWAVSKPRTISLSSCSNSSSQQSTPLLLPNKSKTILLIKRSHSQPEQIIKSNQLLITIRWSRQSLKRMTQSLSHLLRITHNPYNRIRFIWVLPRLQVLDL